MDGEGQRGQDWLIVWMTGKIKMVKYDLVYAYAHLSMHRLRVRKGKISKFREEFSDRVATI